MRVAQFRILKDADGKLRVHLYAANGHLLMTSHEKFTRRSNAERAIERLVTAVATAAETRGGPHEGEQ